MATPLGIPITSSLPSFRTILTQPFSAKGWTLPDPFITLLARRKLPEHTLHYLHAIVHMHLKLCKDLSCTEFEHSYRVDGLETH